MLILKYCDILAAILLPLVSALTVQRSTAQYVHEKRELLADGWLRRHRADKEHVVPVRIGLAQSGLDHGHDLLMEMFCQDKSNNINNSADPESPKYGKHWTAQEVHDFFAPSKDTVAQVSHWLLQHGKSPGLHVTQSFNKQWLQFESTVSELEQLLGTEYFYYEHVSSGRLHIGCEKYHLPAYLQAHVDYITPAVKLVENSSSNKLKRRNATFKQLGMSLEEFMSQSPKSRCSKAITPDCIRIMYNFTKSTTAFPGNALGIFEQGDYYEQESLNTFFTKLAPYIPNGTHPSLRSIDGGIETRNQTTFIPHTEADLDIEVSYPIVYPQKIAIFQTNDPIESSQYAGLYNNIFDAIDGSYCNYSAFGETGNYPGIDAPYPDPQEGGYKGQLNCGTVKPTNVISFSFLQRNEFTLPMNYQRRQCNEIMKLGLQGITMVLASGDEGVAGGSCLSPPPGNPNKNNNSIYNPDSPSGCPYALNVGETRLPPGADPYTDAEISLSGSGGGFSNIFPAPAYQKKAIATYFERFTPPFKSYESHYNDSFAAGGGIFNRAGRGFPDISAVGDHVIVGLLDFTIGIGGTSASAPIVASVLTRINEHRLQAGKSSIGFVNPVLYANPQVLNDITTGPSNGACGSSGFNVTKGWDPVSGLGTPNFPKMLDLFMSLP